METGYEYSGPFLELWPAARRSLIVNQFCYAVRGGAKDVDSVLNWVKNDADNRIDDGYEQQIESQRILRLAIQTEEARKFAEFILWREGLPYSEREKLKAAAGESCRLAWMENKPATPKQLKYLEALACHVVPANMKEASLLIDKYKNGYLSRS